MTSGNTLANMISHAVLGCAVAAAGKQDCASGAVGGASSALIARVIDGGLSGSDVSETTRKALIATGSVAGSALLVGALGGERLTAGNAAANEVTNNYLKHSEAKALSDAKDRRQQCGADSTCRADADKEIQRLTTLDKTRNAELEQACKNPSSSACLGELTKVKIAEASYLGKNEVLDQFGDIGREKAEAASKASQYSNRVNNAGLYNATLGASKAVAGGVVGMVELGILSTRAATGDAEAIGQLSKIAQSLGDFIASPIDSTKTAIQSTLSRANALEVAGKIDEAQRARAELFTNGVITVTGAAALASKAAGGLGKGATGASTANDAKAIAQAKIENGVNADSNFAGGVPVRPRDGVVLPGTAQIDTPIAKHLIEAEIKTNRQGQATTVSGGHNMDNFNQILQTNGGQVIGTPREVAPGIYQVEYRLPGTRHGEVETKTVYDPAKYSDAQMASMANEAVGRAVYQWNKTGTKVPDIQFVEVNGIKFEVPISVYKKQVYVPTAYPSGR